MIVRLLIGGMLWKKNMTEKFLYFTIDGEWLTEFTRSIWADEHNPVRAIEILKDSFPTMESADIIAILTGEKKLAGVSDDDEGLELVEDHTKTTDLGNELSLENIIHHLASELAKVKDERDDITQLLSGVTYKSASEEGFVRIPLRRKQAFENGEVTLVDIVYENIHPVWAGTSLPKLKLEKNDHKEPEPPKPFFSITQDSGWLSPDGKFYPCGYMEHLKTIDKLIGPGEVWKAEKMGWVKIIPGYPYLLCEKSVTEQQAKMLLDWSLENKFDFDMPKWLKRNVKEEL